MEHLTTVFLVILVVVLFVIDRAADEMEILKGTTKRELEYWSSILILRRGGWEVSLPVSADYGITQYVNQFMRFTHTDYPDLEFGYYDARTLDAARCKTKAHLEGMKEDKAEIAEVVKNALRDNS